MSDTKNRAMQTNDADDGAFVLVLATVGLVALVLIAIPQVQALRSSNGMVRWPDALQMLLYWSPILTLQFYLSIVALRRRYRKRKS
jgi:hypothetical protein